MRKLLTLSFIFHLFFLISIAAGDEAVKVKYNEPLGIYNSHTDIGYLNSLIIFLADQLERNIDNKKYSAAPAIVTSFASLDNLKKTSSIGRIISENLIHELQVRKWDILDIRLVKDMIMTDSGEFSLSRDFNQLRNTYKVSCIITGTYSTAGRNIIVNARVIDMDTGTVVSSAQTTMPLNDTTRELIDSDLPLKSFKFVGGQ
jgi:TolB-like protein